MTDKVSNIKHTNSIAYRQTIAEIKTHFDEITKIFNLELNDKEFIKLFEEQAQIDIEKIAEALFKRKKAINNKASKADPETVPFWWGYESQRPQYKPEVRGTPNIFLRSALFSIDKDDNSVLSGVVLPSAKPYQLTYTGCRLHQYDLDLWQTVIHLARGRRFSEEIIIKSSDLYLTQDRVRNGKRDKRIDERLSAMAKCEIEIKNTETDEIVFKGGLLQSYRLENINKSISYKIVIGDALKPLFRYDRFTHVNWEIKQRLSGQFLAQWLHGYISTHISLFPLSLMYIKQLCASSAKEAWRFKETLMNALNELANAYQAANMYFGYELTTKKARHSIRQRQSANVITLPVPEQLLKISYQPSDIQLIALFMRQQAKKHAGTEKTANG
ncbi:MAG: hypothetical protein KGZ80_07110 [Methylomonas sp.]|nr:hypothetical protein [Methylomonas sp.]PPD50534.1 MAG: hypothetical protein CTY13_01570 [Methylobacter sp.]PPD53535.1 MAG: hypothetical protein CTY12_04765 [Methylotenera sp.]